MKEKVYVFGHQNPDSDSICSAISYSYLKNFLDEDHDYIPVALKEVNKALGETNNTPLSSQNDPYSEFKGKQDKNKKGVHSIFDSLMKQASSTLNQTGSNFAKGASDAIKKNLPDIGLDGVLSSAADEASILKERLSKWKKDNNDE